MQQMKNEGTSIYSELQPDKNIWLIRKKLHLVVTKKIQTILFDESGKWE